MATKKSSFTLYKPFIDAYMKAHPDVAKCLCHYSALEEWNKVKKDEKLIKSSIEKYLETSKKLNEIQNEPKPIVVDQKSNTRKRTLSPDDDAPYYHDPLYDPDIIVAEEPTFSKRSEPRSDDVEDDPSLPWVIRGIEKAKARIQAKQAKIEARRLEKESRIKTPAQQAIAKEIEELSDRIANLIQVKNMGLSTEETDLTLRKLIQQKKDRSTELNHLKSKQRAGLRYRQRRKKRLETLCSVDPEVATELLKLYKPTTLSVGTVENVSPDLLRTIEEIARVGGVRDTNMLTNNVYNITTFQPCSSLEELRERIKERGFEIRRSANYYRLITTGAFTEDGKKHSNSTNVRLRKIQNIEQTKHEDYYFVSAILQYIRDLAGTFGNDCVFHLVQDNKASIRIGRPAGRGNSPLIMRLDYQVSTPNDGPIPCTVPHQFKPIIYASSIIDEAGVVTYSGPTYISIRSAKHDRMTIEYDEIDFDRVVKLKEFERTARNHIGEVKPIIILNVDNLYPSDYTRFRKILHSSIKRFKRYNLDVFMLITQAPGQMTLNMVERRLAFLSYDLSGLVLPHHHFGTHLNQHGLTIDADLERINFKKTGEVLAEVWNMNMIDRHSIVVDYLDPPSSAEAIARLMDAKLTLDSIVNQICDEDDNEDIPLHRRIQHSHPAFYTDPSQDNKSPSIYEIDEYWCATHVFQTQYTIQIVRCTKPECCGPWRSNYIQVFPHRFLPPPVPFHRSSNGVRLTTIESSFANLQSVSPYYGTLFQRIQFHGIVVRGTQNQLLPFDAYCPSVEKVLHLRTCSICKQYIPSITRLRKHYQVHQQRYASKYKDVDNSISKKEDIELIDENDPIDPNDLPKQNVNMSKNGVFMFTDMCDWLKSDFEDDPTVEQKQKSTAALASARIRQERMLQAEAVAAIADSQKLISRGTTSAQNSLIQPLESIPIDNATTNRTNDNLTPKKVTNHDVTDGIQQLNVADDVMTDSYDDISDLIDKI